ncbi:Z-ring formation inhibitor MciZ [Thermoflavimicrobium daqui]|uniref:Z-ring formation inhibitor MciZ n=1 Tax=Thermoflavimicrobium daqui TaxID=2137476 RepID=UPI00143CE383|nr:Z-ring formation inhibitor MciZ [Thermoflavimicrobium daqui]
MEVNLSSSGFRLCGKAWQIRAYLRHLSRHSLTVQEFVTRQVHPISNKNRTLV